MLVIEDDGGPTQLATAIVLIGTTVGTSAQMGKGVEAPKTMLPVPQQSMMRFMAGGVYTTLHSDLAVSVMVQVTLPVPPANTRLSPTMVMVPGHVSLTRVHV